MKILLLLTLAATAVFAEERMPVAQQNELVLKYCAVCHTDAARNGGLTLQHFDAARLDPSLAAMLVSKMTGGAIGASGIPMPEKAVRQAWLAAVRAEAAGADKWTVMRTGDVVTAGIVRQFPHRRDAAGEPELYRLKLTCDTNTSKGEMQLSWAPESRSGQLSVSLDGKAETAYAVDGREPMGNGMGSGDHPAAVTLKPALPARTLMISELFPGESVEFPFGELDAKPLAACFR